MKHVITGGAGFIGSNLAEELMNQDEKVVVIDNLSTGSISNLKPFLDKIEFIEGSILDLELLNKIIEKGDIIYHQAAIPSVIRSVKNPIKSSEVNIQGTLNVLLSARENNADRVIFASSSSVYGDSKTLPKVETMLTNPKSPYALTKLTGEYYMKLFYELYGLKTFTLRYFNVFGPKQNPNTQYSAVIPKFIRIFQNREKPVIYGDGKQTRDFSYITNVVQANILCSKINEGYGEIFNVACGQRYSLNELIEQLNKIFNKKIEPIYKEDRQGDVKHSLADISKIKKTLNYEVKTDFFEGLTQLVKLMEKL
ncbi:SDR family oxidoreductase [archaeon]|jgi:nucleoside-diphosphate-sugar epimerase|nr:SDR family oxidoreductase [archaeon]MBT4647221.1 SDR family oxidoreductase [archaeon]MBT5424334.1 SDR family oxidoreductase [archaeon]